ncbi:MAG: sulfotransferase [Alphaproteobacteria bacterium]|nr:sulfotransferase [Alphaproteobacteria bacterium]
MPKGPNFLICGSAASGTSFLANSMSKHPEIYLPKKMRPEPHYFYYSENYANPIQWYEERWFSEVENERAVGEKSTSYMYSPEVAPRIRKHYPDMKMIFILRNPIERAFASYRNTIFNGFEELSFDQAIQQEKARMEQATGRRAETRTYAYADRGYYFKQLSVFLEHFSQEQLLILKFESMIRDPGSTFRTVFRFLNVLEDFSPSPSPRFANWSVIDPAVQIKARQHFGRRFDVIIDSIRRETPPPADLVETESDREIVESVRKNLSRSSAPMSGFARRYLRTAYAEDTSALESLVDFSIEDWL